MDSFNKIMSWFGTALASVGWVSSSFDITSAEAIVSMVCAIIGAVCSVTFSVIVPIVKKVIEAKRDGHIDTDEALGILDEVSKGCEKVKTELDKQNKDD